MPNKLIAILVCCLVCSHSLLYGQTDPGATPAGYAAEVQTRTGKISDALTQQDQRYLDQFARLESRLMNKLQKQDSSAAGRIPPANYQQFLQALQAQTAGMTSGNLNVANLPPSISHLAYNARLDTLKTSLRYLQQLQGGPDAMNKIGTMTAAGAKLTSSLAQVNQLEGKLQVTTQIQQYLQQRQQLLTGLLQQYTHLPAGITSIFNRYKATGYYYRQQIQVYKDMLNDPTKMEQQAVAVLSKVPAYQQFLSEHSELASLFPKPDGLGTPAALNGLQTKAQVQGLLQQQSASGGQSGQQYMQQQVDQAQTMLNRIKANVTKYGQNGANLDMPGFQPNTQKTKTFLHRLQYGAAMQFGNSTNYYPATANISLSVGYKLNDKSTVGVGAGYVMGMGNGWKDIRFTSQGLSLRTFMDWKIKGTYYVTGGYEEDYLTGFSSVAQLRNPSAWQKSALIGAEKKYRISSKVQGNLQLLYNLLYEHTLPPGQPLQFRVGYNF